MDMRETYKNQKPRFRVIKKFTGRKPCARRDSVAPRLQSHHPHGQWENHNARGIILLCVTNRKSVTSVFGSRTHRPENPKHITEHTERKGAKGAREDEERGTAKPKRQTKRLDKSDRRPTSPTSLFERPSGQN